MNQNDQRSFLFLNIMFKIGIYILRSQQKGMDRVIILFQTYSFQFISFPRLDQFYLKSLWHGVEESSLCVATVHSQEHVIDTFLNCKGCAIFVLGEVLNLT